jgi:polyferredoxin
MTRQRRPDPPPLQTDDVPIAAVGAAAFAVAFVALLFVPLDAGDRWWRWVCLVGFLMGLFACWYVPRLHRRRAQAEAHRASR